MRDDQSSCASSASRQHHAGGGPGRRSSTPSCRSGTSSVSASSLYTDRSYSCSAHRMKSQRRHSRATTEAGSCVSGTSRGSRGTSITSSRFKGTRAHTPSELLTPRSGSTPRMGHG
jgi:hypothetical protein